MHCAPIRKHAIVSHDFHASHHITQPSIREREVAIYQVTHGFFLAFLAGFLVGFFLAGLLAGFLADTRSLPTAFLFLQMVGLISFLATGVDRRGLVLDASDASTID